MKNKILIIMILVVSILMSTVCFAMQIQLPEVSTTDLPNSSTNVVNQMLSIFEFIGIILTLFIVGYF